MSYPRIVTIIPARGGSKGLPGKSLIPLGGVPLIGWSIKAAKEARFGSHVVVSTDSPEIARVSEQLGAIVPCLRPAEISGDEANVEDAISHMLTVLKERGHNFDLLSVLFLTHPYRSPLLLDQLVEMCLAGAEQAITAQQWMFDPREWFLSQGQMLEPLSERFCPVPPFEVIHEFNLANVSWLAAWKGSYPPGSASPTSARRLPAGVKPGKIFWLVDDPASCVDIDTPSDLEAAGQLLTSGAVKWHPNAGGDYLAKAAPISASPTLALEVVTTGAAREVLGVLRLASIGSPEEIFHLLSTQNYPRDRPLILRPNSADGLGTASIKAVPGHPAISLDTTRALGSGLRQRKSLEGSTASWKPLTVGGLLSYAPRKGWINELSGELITGRQHCPPVYRWKGIATFPALTSFDATQHKRWRTLESC